MRALAQHRSAEHLEHVAIFRRNSVHTLVHRDSWTNSKTGLSPFEGTEQLYRRVVLKSLIPACLTQDAEFGQM